MPFSVFIVIAVKDSDVHNKINQQQQEAKAELNIKNHTQRIILRSHTQCGTAVSRLKVLTVDNLSLSLHIRAAVTEGRASLSTV